MGICTTRDEYVPECHWVANLSDNTTVFQDDGRPGEEPQSAWLRLKAYCESNNLYIASLRLQFRSHLEIMDEGNGYFLTKAAAGFWGAERTFDQFGVGVLKDDGKVHITFWMSPELIQMNTDVRCPKKCEYALIRKI